MNKKIIIFLLTIFFIFSFYNGGFGMKNNKNVHGIIFFKTKNLEKIKEFYLEKIGCDLWLDQGGCAIFNAGNMLFGFCQREECETEGIITFFYSKKQKIDELYEKFKKIALDSPKQNKKYKIYHFFAKDPDGRLIEFQKFLHELKPIGNY